MANLALDPDLLARYDRPGPRYTSYPTAPHFHADFGQAQLREAAAASNAAGRALSLYVHVPFCASPCFYCGCNRIITRDRSRGEAYLAHLFTEIELTAAMFDATRPVRQLHLGGGTPNFLNPKQLGLLVEKLRTHFNLSDASDSDCDLSIELDPRFVSPADIGELARIGFNRASFGVQDFNPVVQEAVNRVQSIEQTQAVVDACRASGIRSVNVDLIYGLPKQTARGFGRTLDIVTAMRPDRVAVYGYAHMPQLFRPQRQIEAEDLPDAATRLELLQLAIEKLSAAGYEYIGMDHFALPDDELSIAQRRGDLHRNFMGYTTHGGSDLIGLGVSAISHVGETFSQNPRDLPSWEHALNAAQLPVFRGMSMDSDDTLRAELIQTLMCHGEIPVRELEQRHAIDFSTYFADALQRLALFTEDGLIEITPDRIRATPRGRLLLRNLAMCFDRYLQPAEAQSKPQFSRAI